MIGIVGGVGPYAGLDLQQKILEQTKATADQDHLGIISWSEPGIIPDRTAFLLGETPLNPALPGATLAAWVRPLYGDGHPGLLRPASALKQLEEYC